MTKLTNIREYLTLGARHRKVAIAVTQGASFAKACRQAGLNSSRTRHHAGLQKCLSRYQTLRDRTSAAEVITSRFDSACQGQQKDSPWWRAVRQRINNDFRAVMLHGVFPEGMELV